VMRDVAAVILLVVAVPAIVYLLWLWASEG
jgi:hypothetical protein